MKYTPEQLREKAATYEAGTGLHIVLADDAKQMRSYADALDRIERLENVIAGGHCIRGEAGKSPCEQLQAHAEAMILFIKNVPTDDQLDVELLGTSGRQIYANYLRDFPKGVK